jgi:hypothetical protein
LPVEFFRANGQNSSARGIRFNTGNNMRLRDHPLILCSWPPVWWASADLQKKQLCGEIGILKAVQPYDIQPADRFYLLIEHEESEYLGILVIEDYALCQQVFVLIARHCGRTIGEVGDIDLSHTL